MASGATGVTGYKYGYQGISGKLIDNIILIGPTGTTGTTSTTGTSGTTGIIGPTGSYRTSNLSVIFGSPNFFSSNTSFSGQVKTNSNNTINQIWGT